jgi:xanthine dehydrogenase accessory factor
MNETLAQLERILASREGAAMATLVATRGTTPKKEGSKMWVGADGAILGSVTIGGCVDARVIEESEAVIAGGEPRFISMHLGEEEAWDLGLSCAGDVDVFVEPVAGTASDPTVETYRRIEAEVAAGRAVALVTRLGGDFGRMLVREDDDPVGSLGSGALDREAIEAAAPLTRQGISRTVALADGAAPAFVEVHAPPATLAIFGATEVAIHLVALAHEVGLRTVVVDGRSRFANRDRFPLADELIVAMPSEVANEMSYNARTAVVLLAHDYKYDIPVLKAVLGTDVPYVGLLGSRRRGAAIREFLEADGLDTGLLDSVHVPAGLDIGAEEAPTIALSILSELLAVTAGRSGGSLAAKNRSGGT